MAKTAHLPFADYLKGLLILLVIFGHLIPDEPDYIYVFHMPLFLAVSGYLLLRQRLQETTLAGLCSRYWQRMLLAWAVAWVVFNGGAFAARWLQAELTFGEVWSRFIHPHGHLWFIPALFGMILLTFACERLRFNPLTVLICSAVFAFVWEAVWEHTLAGEGIMAWLPERRIITLFVFFYAGYYVRNFAPGIKTGAGAAAAVLAAAWLRSWGHQAHLHSWAMAAAWMTLNGGLILLCISRMTLKALPAQRLLGGIGVYSLPIYLWHMLPITLLRNYLHHDRAHPLLFYALCAGLIAAFMAALPLFGRRPL